MDKKTYMNEWIYNILKVGEVANHVYYALPILSKILNSVDASTDEKEIIADFLTYIDNLITEFNEEPWR